MLCRSLPASSPTTDQPFDNEGIAALAKMKVVIKHFILDVALDILHRFEIDSAELKNKTRWQARCTQSQDSTDGSPGFAFCEELGSTL